MKKKSTDEILAQYMPGMKSVDPMTSPPLAARSDVLPGPSMERLQEKFRRLARSGEFISETVSPLLAAAADSAGDKLEKLRRAFYGNLAPADSQSDAAPTAGPASVDVRQVRPEHDSDDADTPKRRTVMIDLDEGKPSASQG